jgi:hypothetical protein
MGNGAAFLLRSLSPRALTGHTPYGRHEGPEGITVELAEWI